LNNLLTNQARESRANRIWARRADWGDDVCQALVNGKIRVGMTKEMIQLAFGNPTNIDRNRSDG
jgi:hypothetical protein